ncbi:MAG: DUF3276 family protein [Bacteroidales bacterium]|nr:DUF3276 family protein [Bacteroidales bacterium]
MEEVKEKKGGFENNNREEIFSKAVRAGKRTYFFDVKATRRNDYYLTLTESKKRFSREGQPFFEKHKIFLYKEDFEKFSDGLQEVIAFIKEANPVMLEKEPEETTVEKKEDVITNDYTNVDFEDLEDKTE